MIMCERGDLSLKHVKGWLKHKTMTNKHRRGGGFCRTIKHTKCPLKHKMINECDGGAFIGQWNTLEAHQNARWQWTSVRGEGVSFKEWQNTLHNRQNTRQWKWHIRKGWGEFCRTIIHTGWPTKNKTTRIIHNKGVEWVLWTMSKHQMTTKTQRIMMTKDWGVIIDVDDLHHILQNYLWKSAIMYAT